MTGGAEDLTVARTGVGEVIGRRDPGRLRFLGIPYGEPPTGPLRFALPQPRRPWTMPREALDWPPPCPQVRLAKPDKAQAGTGLASEDCLRLNVFTPAADGARRPVMVYLHGGGWTNYTAGTPFLDASRLAATQDVVVVTVNHRLGVLGFLPLEGPGGFDEAANVGLFDLCLALGWVRANIAGFGGDPGCVTIFGQSGGGAKVAALMGFAPAAGLFHRAIVQSSSGSTRATEPEQARAGPPTWPGPWACPRCTARRCKACRYRR